MPTDKQRREAERRRLQRQAQRRAQRARARRRLTIIASIVGALVIVAVIVLFVTTTSDDDKTTAAKQASTGKQASAAPVVPTSSAATSPSAGTSSSAPPGTCTYTRSGTAARTVALPATVEPTKGTVKVAITTTRGALTFTLDRAKTPCTVGSFVSLVKQKYFNKTPCHRLTTAGIFVLQCGDPTGTGTGGPGYKFDDELTGKEKYTRGVLAMANSGANTNGSQFFIVYKNSTLGPQYTIFGSVTAGLPVVDAVAAKGAVGGTDGKPKESISITNAVVR